MSRDVLLVHATWVRPEAWFWECARPGCGCAFGPLTTERVAAVQADEHIRDNHPATDVTGPAVTRPAGPEATNPRSTR